jgi:hypothetical protein
MDVFWNDPFEENQNEHVCVPHPLYALKTWVNNKNTINIIYVVRLL